MSSNSKHDMNSDEKSMEDALIITTGMLFNNVQDMIVASAMIIERHPELSEVASMLRSIASSSHNVSRMAVNVMPKRVRDKLDEIWSGVSAEKAKAVAMEERGESPLN
jgi:hypothetical protein